MLNLPIITKRIAHSSTTADPPPVSPQDLGLPDKFTGWRSSQWDAASRIVVSPKRFVVICAATGFGKTLAYAAAALLSGDRTVILTATKGLQEQISNDFAGLSSDIRGLNNYLCSIADQLGIPRDTSVADAPCQCGYRCMKKIGGGCEYYDRYRVAQRADITVTNYACWLHDGSKPESERGDLQFGVIPDGLDIEEDVAIRDRQGVKLLICDEAHSAGDCLGLFLGVDFSRHECLTMKLDWPDSGMTVDEWREWSTGWKGEVGKRLGDAETRAKNNNNGNGDRGWSRDIKHLRDIKRKLDRLADMQSVDGWILNESDVNGKSMSGVRFDPLSPARYAEETLWRGIEKIVLVSATVRPKTAELLGIPNSDLEFVEYDSSFDPKRRPTIYVPTGVRMTYKTEQDDNQMRWWLAKLDDVIDGRLHQKGILHAVSYRRAEFVYNNSRHAQHMMMHKAWDRAQVVERFRRSEPPAIIVSPSLDTGYDFHGPDARWQCVLKIPFASTRDKLIKARQEKDKDYGLYLAAQTLVQMAGRIVRSETDWGATIILDANFEWMYWKAKHWMPLWFQEAVQWADGIPEVLEFED